MKKLAGVYVKSIFILPFELSRYHLFCIAETLVWMLIFTDCEICFSGCTVKEGDQQEQGSSILIMVLAYPPCPCCILLIALPSAAILVTGGRSEWDWDWGIKVEALREDGTPLCNLPDLPFESMFM